MEGERTLRRRATGLAAIGVPVVVLAQYSRGHWMADAEGKARDFRAVRKVLGYASGAGLVPFDLSEARGIDALFRSDHHSAEGNRVGAELIMHELVRRHLLPHTSTSGRETPDRG